MSIRITAIHLSADGSTHEHITDLAWRDYVTGQTREDTKSTIVKFLEEGGKAFVETGASKCAVGVARPAGGTPHLRTFSNGTWTDSLLSLPRY